MSLGPQPPRRDLAGHFFTDLKQNEFVIPGEPDNSYLLDLVRPMPPERPAMPQQGSVLSESELSRLRRWIEQGADWPADVVLEPTREHEQSDWWSLRPIANVEPPVVDDLPEPWRENPIDRFIFASLKAHGLAPSPPADRRTLIRRLSFDLLGLPPTLEQIRRFEKDTSPDAYARLVDRMLASPAYGERYARHWLDIAHYADTHGFERDKRRDHAWRYRDYVIEALNTDKPYDRFLQEQIAGDLLWPDDPNAVIATGFLAAGPWDYVGQVETKSPELRRAARSLDLDDMATQVLTSTVAMTIHCARCHDHKLDPISQREYYELRTVFAGLRRSDRVVHDSTIERLEQLGHQLTRELQQLQPGLDLADIVGGGDGTGTGVANQGIDPRTGQPESKRMGFLDSVEPNTFVETESSFIEGVFVPGPVNESGSIPLGAAGVTIPIVPGADGRAWDIIRNGPVNSQHSPHLSGIDFSKPGNRLLGLHANAGISFALHEFRNRMQADQLRFTARVGYFGHADPNSFADAWVFLDGRKVAEFRQLKRTDGLKPLDIPIPITAQFLTLVSTAGGNGIGMDQIGFGNPMLVVDGSALSRTQLDRIANLRSKLDQLESRLTALRDIRVYAVQSDEDPATVRLLERGNPETPIGPPLAPRALSAVRTIDPDLTSNPSNDIDPRAALADWLTHSENPLTDRVIVNRIWHWHFGNGIVDTPSDFGRGGSRPSHPELLDWLAAEFRRQGSSLKSMHRLIVNTAAYRQISRFDASTPGAIQDADNRLLWRQNPRRIEAEAIRDSILFVSGQLNRQRGGPGYEDFEYQEAYAPIYTYITADEPQLWKRSIYRYLVRTTPDPFMTTLDCPDPANMTPKRLTSTTALQSLALFNNDFVLRQSHYFATRLKHEAKTEAECVRRAFELALSRSPTQDEQAAALDLVERQGLMHLCRVLFNANEFVYVD